MATEKFSNFGASTLNGGINNSVTTLIVTSAATFPSSGQFRILIGSEIMLVTAVSTNTFTVTRGVESTSAASHSNADAVTQILTAASLAQTINDNKPVASSAPCTADTSLASGSWTDITGCTFSLTAGTYLITATVNLHNSGVTQTAGCKIYYGSTVLIADEFSLTGGFAATFSMIVPAVIGSTQTVKLAGRMGGSTFEVRRYGDVDIGNASLQGTILSAVLLS